MYSTFPVPWLGGISIGAVVDSWSIHASKKHLFLCCQAYFLSTTAGSEVSICYPRLLAAILFTVHPASVDI